jgi:hypothetical protein
VQALLQHPRSRKSSEALLGNIFSLEEVVGVVQAEMNRFAMHVVALVTPSGIPTSRFLKNVTHRLRHGEHKALFLGGLIAIAKPGEDKDHIVAVTAIHEDKTEKKATIVDTGPSKLGSAMIRDVPLAWIDRNIMEENGYGPTAVVFLAMRRSEDDVSSTSQVRTQLIERKRIFAYIEQNPDITGNISKKKRKRERRIKYI